MSAPNRQCLLLDMGRVLLDFDFQQFRRRLCSLTGRDEGTLRAAYTANALEIRYESGTISDQEFHREVCSGLGVEIPWNDFVSAWNAIFNPHPILPGDLIQALAAQAELWVVSNTNKLHFEFLLQSHAFLRHFKGFILSYEVGVLKPDPRIFREALRRAEVQDPSQALFVDDQEANVQAARDMGIDAFQFLDRQQFTEEIRKRKILG